MDRNKFDALCNTPANNNWEGHAKETYGWWAQQNPEELWWLIEKLNKINTRTILEIGSAHGGTLFFWDQVAGNGGKVASLDLWAHHGITMDFTPDKTSSEVVLVQGSSHEQKSLEKIKQIFPDPIDFLFIDGDHTYEGVKMDYEMYSPLVRPGGLVAFHDIVYDTDIQVRRFFLEITEPKEMIELYHGIGVVYK